MNVCSERTTAHLWAESGEKFLACYRDRNLRLSPDNSYYKFTYAYECGYESWISCLLVSLRINTLLLKNDTILQ